MQNSLGTTISDGNDTDRYLLEKQGITWNWPYDYFSLVENVKIKVDIELGKEEIEQPEPDPNYTGPQIEALPAVIGDIIASDSNADSQNELEVRVVQRQTETQEEDGNESAELEISKRFVNWLYPEEEEDTPADNEGGGGKESPEDADIDPPEDLDEEGKKEDDTQVGGSPSDGVDSGSSSY